MLKQTGCALVLAATLATSAAAQSMNADTFYTRGRALEKKGIMALMSSDFGTLRTEMQSAVKAVDARERAARAGGAAPTYCRTGKAKLSAQEVLNEMGRIPAAQRRAMTTTDAWHAIVKRRFPCS